MFRFLVEFLRDEPGREALGVMSTSQRISLGVEVMVLAAIAFRSKGSRGRSAGVEGGPSR